MECSKQTISYPSSNQIDTVVATIWSPPEEAKGIVQICHGMCEYIDRYDHFARYLAGHGYLVCGNDHIGHGRTAGSEEKLGYFSPSGGGKHLTDDVHQLVQRMQREYPSLPYFLLGHSMGSFITRNYIVQYPKGLSGYICCGTSGPNPLAGIGLRTANHLIKKHGDHYRSELLQSLAFKNYNKRFGKDAGQFAWVSSDLEITDAYEKDPHCNFIFTAGGFRDLFSLLQAVSAEDWAARVNKYLPILIISGEMDPVGGYGKGVEKVYRKLSDCGVYDLKMKLYFGARHELINEVNKEEVFADILNWIEKRI